MSDIQWHELTDGTRQEIRRTVAAMMIVGVLKTYPPYFWEAVRDIGRDWLKRHAPDALETKGKETP
jgi:hypothetical protein